MGIEIITKKLCYVCKKAHEWADWRWRSKRINRKKVFYCSKGIDCIGCQELHLNDTGGSKLTSRGEVCRKHVNLNPTQEQRMKNMSTEDILSGAQHGLPNQFKRHSEDYTPEVRQQERRELKEALK